MGYGLVLPSFLPSFHLLKSSTFKTISITAAIKNNTWKNWIMALSIYNHEVIVFGENVSSNHTAVLQPGLIPLLKWRLERIHGKKAA